MKLRPLIEAPAEDDVPSVFAAACCAYYDSAADGIASNFGSFNSLDIEPGNPVRPAGVSLADRARGMVRFIARAIPGAAGRRRADLSARFAGVIAIDRSNR
jgi:hypothetical protein